MSFKLSTMFGGEKIFHSRQNYSSDSIDTFESLFGGGGEQFDWPLSPWRGSLVVSPRRLFYHKINLRLNQRRAPDGIEI